MAKYIGCEDLRQATVLAITEMVVRNTLFKKLKPKKDGTDIFLEVPDTYECKSKIKDKVKDTKEEAKADKVEKPKTKDKKKKKK